MTVRKPGVRQHVISVWPVDGSTIYPFLSSVDNGWFAAALMVVRNAGPWIAGYIGIGHGQIPSANYFATVRVFPDTCDWSWLEQKPADVRRINHGIDVFEGAYSYRGMHIVPSWGAPSGAISGCHTRTATPRTWRAPNRTVVLRPGAT